MKNLWTLFLKKRTPWKIMFLIYADLRENSLPYEVFETPDDILEEKAINGTLSELEALFQTIRSFPLADHYHIYIIYNRIQFTSEIFNDRTFVLELAQGEAKNRFKVIGSNKVRNFFQKPASIAKTLGKLNRRDRSEHNLIFIWGHGYDFGIFREANKMALSGNKITSYNPANNTLYVRNAALKTIIPDNIRTTHRYFSNNNKENFHEPFKDILSNDELGFALEKAFTSQKVDILAMMNCSMQNIFTCYSLKCSCKIFIAPMGTITVPGYNYPHIIGVLKANPGIAVNALAEEVIGSIEAEGHLKPGEGLDWAIFGAQLDLCPDYITFIESLAEKIMEAINNDWESIKPVLLDLHSSLQHFDNGIVLADLKELIYEAADNCGACFFSPFVAEIDKRATAFFLSKNYVGPAFENKIPKPSGSGILYPKKLKDFYTRNQEFYPVYFNSRNRHYLRINEHFKWNKFLDLYRSKEQD